MAVALAGSKAPMRPPAWEPPYDAGAALERAKKKKKENVYMLETLNFLSSL